MLQFVLCSTNANNELVSGPYFFLYKKVVNNFPKIFNFLFLFPRMRIKNVHSIVLYKYPCLIYGHECFTGKYTTPLACSRIVNSEDIDDAISRFFMVI